MRRAVIAALAAAWVPASAVEGPTLHAQATPTPSTVKQAAVDTLFDPRTNAALQRVLDAARAAGLPDAPLRNRLRQGAARGVSGERVLALVRAHADSMRAAREALGVRATADELDAGAAALHAGATRAMLRRLRAMRADGTATTAMVVLTDLLWRGVAADDAADAIATIAQRSPDRALLALQGAVAREGTPATSRKLQALVERVAPSRGDAGAQRPLRRPLSASDSLQHRTASSAVTLSSLSAPAPATPLGLVAEGRLAIPIGSRWEVAPWGAWRAGDAARWGAALTIAREFPLARATSSRVWVTGELRDREASAPPSLVPYAAREAATSDEPPPADHAIVGGGEMLRRVGPWTVGATLSLGRTNFSRQETRLVPRVGGPQGDTLGPRPDTIRQQTGWVRERRWFARSSSALRGALSLERGDFSIEGGVSRQLGLRWGTGDSASRRPRTMVTLGAEHRLAPWATLVAQWASHDPSRVNGTLALTDARWRLGLRVTERARPPAPGPAAPPPATTPDDAILVDVSADSVVRSADGAVLAWATIRVQLAGRRGLAQQVEVEGDLTAWQPVALRAEANGLFVGSFPIASSLVRLRMRVNGGAWITPPGAATQHDDLGDQVAVYVLPL